MLHTLFQCRDINEAADALRVANGKQKDVSIWMLVIRDPCLPSIWLLEFDGSFWDAGNLVD